MGHPIKSDVVPIIDEVFIELIDKTSYFQIKLIHVKKSRFILGYLEDFCQFLNSYNSGT